MKAKVKFKFILKNGLVFESIVSVNDEEYTKLIRVIQGSFAEGVDGQVTLDNCVVKLSECAVVDWEVLENE